MPKRHFGVTNFVPLQSGDQLDLQTFITLDASRLPASAPAPTTLLWAGPVSMPIKASSVYSNSFLSHRPGPS